MPSGRRTGRKPDYEWEGGSFAINAIGAANQIQSPVSVLAPLTLMRTRGQILVGLEATPAAGEQFAVAIGIIIGTDAQLTAGLTAFPNPATVLDAAWLWHQWVPLAAETAVMEQSDGGMVHRVIIDSKAMRKMKPNENIVVVAAGNVLAGAPTAFLIGGLRCLLAS